jgi:hypothetical protein
MMRFVRDHLTAVGVVLLPLGCLAATENKLRLNVFHVWLGACILYLVVVSGGNIRQNYYQLHFIPPAAALIGIGWERLSNSRRFWAHTNYVLAGLFLALAAWGVEPMFEPYGAIQAASRQLDALDPTRQPVIIYPPGYGCLYYFNRPGWVGREGMGKPVGAVPAEDEPANPEYADSRIRRGARWAVSFTPKDGVQSPLLHKYLSEQFGVATECADYTIFDLSMTPGGRRYRPPPQRPERSNTHGQDARATAPTTDE